LNEPFKTDKTRSPFIERARLSLLAGWAKSDRALAAY